MKRMARYHRRRRFPRVHRVALRSRRAYPPASARVSCLARLRRGSKPPPRRDPKRRRSVSTAALRRARVRDASPARPLRICTSRLTRDGGGRLIAASGVPFAPPADRGIGAAPRRATKAAPTQGVLAIATTPRRFPHLLSLGSRCERKIFFSSGSCSPGQERSTASLRAPRKGSAGLHETWASRPFRFLPRATPLFTTPLPGYSLTHPLQLYLTLPVSDRLRCGSGVYLGAADP